MHPGGGQSVCDGASTVLMQVKFVCAPDSTSYGVLCYAHSMLYTQAVAHRHEWHAAQEHAQLSPHVASHPSPHAKIMHVGTTFLTVRSLTARQHSRDNLIPTALTESSHHNKQIRSLAFTPGYASYCLMLLCECTPPPPWLPPETPASNLSRRSDSVASQSSPPPLFPPPSESHVRTREHVRRSTACVRPFANTPLHVENPCLQTRPSHALCLGRPLAAKLLCSKASHHLCPTMPQLARRCANSTLPALCQQQVAQDLLPPPRNKLLMRIKNTRSQSCSINKSA